MESAKKKPEKEAKASPEAKTSYQASPAAKEPKAATTYPAGEPVLPPHYSFLSAQKGPEHNEAAHQKLKHDLLQNGFAPHEVEGNYGYDEKSYMVAHDGSERSKKTLEDIAFKKHGQESIIHSSEGRNELKFANGTPSWRGEGYSHGEDHTEYATKLPTGHRFRLNVEEPKKEEPHKDLVPKDLGKSELKQPHRYGEIDGVHVYQAMDHAHASLKGEHLYNPDDETFDKAIKNARKEKSFMVIIHGNPPKKLLSTIHPDLGAHMAGKALKKAILHQDKSTKGDPNANAQMAAHLPKELLDFGQEHLAPMKKDDFKEIPFKDHAIKVRKHDADIYSGAIHAPNGDIVHSFDKVSMPELLSHIRSKFEMYGKEQGGAEEKVAEPKAEPSKDVVTMPKDEFIEEHKHLVQVLESPSHEDDKVEAKKQKKELDEQIKGLGDEPAIGTHEVIGKLTELRDKIKSKLTELETPKEENVSIPMATATTEEQKDECDACGSRKVLCDCYDGLSKPEIEIDYKEKKIRILFKSEWSSEDKEAFIDDLKGRVTKLIRRK